MLSTRRPTRGHELSRESTPVDLRPSGWNQSRVVGTSSLAVLLSRAYNSDFTLPSTHSPHPRPPPKVIMPLRHLVWSMKVTTLAARSANIEMEGRQPPHDHGDRKPLPPAEDGVGMGDDGWQALRAEISGTLDLTGRGGRLSSLPGSGVQLRLMLSISANRKKVN